MNKTRLITLNLLILSLTATAQNYEWARSFGSPNESDDVTDICVDSWGNIYVTGGFEGTVDFDPGIGTSFQTSTGDKDVFIQKLDNAGNFIWVKTFGGFDREWANSISADTLGNIYTTGRFIGTVDFDPGSGTDNQTSMGDEDIFIHKLDSAGNFKWAHAFGNTGFDVGSAITSDNFGNIYATGHFDGSVDFDPGIGSQIRSSNGAGDLFVLKLDSSGQYIWAISAGDYTSDAGISICLDDYGNVYTTGIFYGTVDFDPGTGTTNLSSNINDNVFVQKLNNAGNLIWAKAFGGQKGTSISVDRMGNVLTLGDFYGTIDSDPGLGVQNFTSIGSSDIFIHKLDSLGNFKWAKSFGSSSGDWSYGICTDTLGNVYTTGCFQNTVDFDPSANILNISSNGTTDIFVHKLDSSGVFKWVETYGSPNYDQGLSIAIDNSNNIFLTGIYNNTVDFNPNGSPASLTSSGYSDNFILKLNQCQSNSSIDTQIACESYTWIDGNTYTTSNSSATYTLSNVSGCDSVITLNLTINNVSDLSTSTFGLTITANNSGASYQWLNCDNNNVEIIGETGQSFTAISNGNYAVELTENSCVDTSDCISITTVGILENSFGNNILVYPNPTKGSFSIDLGVVFENTQISINDISGRLIDSINIAQSQILNLSIDEPAGIYLISIQSTDKNAVIRLVKE